MREFITRLLPPDVKSRLKGLLHIPDMEFSRRPLHDALFQTDMLFVRQDSPIIASKRWK